MSYGTLCACGCLSADEYTEVIMSCMVFVGLDVCQPVRASESGVFLSVCVTELS